MSKGVGRGAFIRKLLEKESSSSGVDTSSCEAGNKTTGTEGIFDSRPSCPTQDVGGGDGPSSSVESTKDINRTNVSTGDSVSSDELAPKPRGRGKFIQMILKKSVAEESKSTVSTTSSGDSPAAITDPLYQSKYSGGRGRIIINEKSNADSVISFTESTKETGSTSSAGKINFEMDNLSLKSDSEPVPIIKKGQAGESISQIIVDIHIF